MFKLGWGTPTLVTVDLGIVLQVPSPIVIVLLGTLSASLPRPEGAVVEINLDIVGVLEVTEKRLSIDASLRDSRIAAFTLTGDLALRFSWGADPDFALSLGGFNPAFRPPPGFPTLRRLSLALGSGANPRLSLAAYFALTSNSLQFGARAELYADRRWASRCRGTSSSTRSSSSGPSASASTSRRGSRCKRGNSVLAAITVTGQLKGPRPWYIKATASITVLFFDVSVSDRARPSARPPEPELAAPVDVWDASCPPSPTCATGARRCPIGRPRGVSTAADGETPPRVRLDPMSQLAVRQKVLPLDRRITKLGEAVIGPLPASAIRAVRVGATPPGGPAPAHHEARERALRRGAVPDADRRGAALAALLRADGRGGGGPRQRRSCGRGNRPAPVQWRTLRLEPSDRDASTAPGPVSATRAGKLGAVDAAKGAALRTTGMERFAPPEGKRPLVALAPEALDTGVEDRPAPAGGGVAFEGSGGERRGAP
jgi:hypothetical protein